MSDERFQPICLALGDYLYNATGQVMSVTGYAQCSGVPGNEGTEENTLHTAGDCCLDCR